MFPSHKVAWTNKQGSYLWRIMRSISVRRRCTLKSMQFRRIVLWRSIRLYNLDCLCLQKLKPRIVQVCPQRSMLFTLNQRGCKSLRRVWQWVGATNSNHYLVEQAMPISQALQPHSVMLSTLAWTQIAVLNHLYLLCIF